GERRGSHGLFTDEGVPIVLSQVKAEIDDHPGNVWGLIFSLKREDAERLGYNNASQWMNLLRSRRNDIAQAMRISPGNLRWYAAYHDKEDHPHVHMLVWSKRPHEPYLNPQGIETIKRTIAGDIFRQDLISIYDEQTRIRDDIRACYRERMREIVEKISQSTIHWPEMEMLFLTLTARVRKTKGKKVYGYLDKNTKKIVDEIVQMIATDTDIAELYDLWYKCKCEINRTYTDADPMKIPIEENKEFKSIRNAVVNIAVHYGDKLNQAEVQNSSDDSAPKPLPKFNGYITALFRHASSIIDNSSAMEDCKAPVVDSKLRREIEQKKRGEMSMV
ncbi:MAG: serine/threonine protein phosphatase, partial [Clostridia bacterium]|nr:serine/threonine protein phosphatase [Clostridia bacterium]